jgi:hypothetical protein
VTVRQWVSQYTVSGVAAEKPEQYAGIWHIEVTRAMQMDGTELWAARWMGRCLNRRGQWDLEPIPSDRTDRWLASHRFPFDEAMRLAEKAAPDVTVNGLRAAEVVR